MCFSTGLGLGAKDIFCAVPQGAAFFIEIGSFCGLRLRKRLLVVWLSNREWKKVEAQEVKILGRRVLIFGFCKETKR